MGRLAMLQTIESRGLTEVAYAVSSAYARRKTHGGPGLPPPSTDPDFLAAMNLRNATFKSIGVRLTSLVSPVTDYLAEDEEDELVVAALHKLRRVMQGTAEALMDVGIIRVRANVDDMTKDQKVKLKGYKWIVRIQALLVSAAIFKEAEKAKNHAISQWITDYRRLVGAALSMLAQYRLDHSQLQDETVNRGVVALGGQLPDGVTLPGAIASGEASDSRSRSASPDGHGRRSPSPSSRRSPTPPAHNSSTAAPPPPKRTLASTFLSLLPSFLTSSGRSKRRCTLSPPPSSTHRSPSAARAASASPTVPPLPSQSGSAGAASPRQAQRSRSGSPDDADEDRESSSSGSSISLYSIPTLMGAPHLDGTRPPVTFNPFPATLEELKVCINGKTSKTTGAVITESEAEKPFLPPAKPVPHSSRHWKPNDVVDESVMTGMMDGGSVCYRAMPPPTDNSFADVVFVVLATLPYVHLAVANVDSWHKFFSEAPVEVQRAAILFAGYVRLFNRKGVKRIFAWDLKKAVMDVPKTPKDWYKDLPGSLCPPPTEGDAFAFFRHTLDELVCPILAASGRSSVTETNTEIECGECGLFIFENLKTQIIDVRLEVYEEEAVQEEGKADVYPMKEEVTLQEVLSHYRDARKPDDYACGNCGKTGVCKADDCIVKLKDICIIRFTLDDEAESPKKFKLPAGRVSLGKAFREAWKTRYLFMPVAYILHRGSELDEGLHTAFVRPTPESPWFFFDEMRRREAVEVPEAVLENEAAATIGRPLMAIFYKLPLPPSDNPYHRQDDEDHPLPLFWSGYGEDTTFIATRVLDDDDGSYNYHDSLAAMPHGPLKAKRSKADG